MNKFLSVILTITFLLCSGCTTKNNETLKKNSINHNTTTSDLTLTAYQQQGIVATVNNRIADEYGFGNYDRVDFDNMKFSFDGDIVTVKVSVSVTQNNNKYSVPAEFDLEYLPSSGKYELIFSDFDDEKIIKEETKEKEPIKSENLPDNKTDKKDNDIKTNDTPTELKGLTLSDDSFEVNVSSSITVTTKVPEGSRVVTTATDEDGKEIIISDVSGNDKEETKTLPSGKYKIQAYSSGAGWSWSFTCQ